MKDLHLGFHWPALGVLPPSSHAFLIWRPAEGRTGDVVLFSSHGMFESSPSLLHDDGPHAVLAESGEKFVSGDDLKPKYAHNINIAQRIT